MQEPPSLPARQLQAFRLVRRALAAGKPVSHGWLAGKMKCSKGTAQRFLNALRVKGLLSGPEVIRWGLTPEGEKFGESLDS